MSEGKTGHPVGGAETKRYDIVEASCCVLRAGSSSLFKFRSRSRCRAGTSKEFGSFQLIALSSCVD